MLKKFLLVVVTFICACEPHSRLELRPEVPKRQISESNVKDVSLGFGTIELMPLCQATTPEFEIDCYFGNVLCPMEGLEFYYEGGLVMPLVKKSDRRFWNQFKLETLPDGNVLAYGISKIKEKPYYYASICPANQEFGCATFILKTLDDKNVPRFLSIVRTFKLTSLSGYLQTQAARKS
jgi:hypothetical protein